MGLPRTIQIGYVGEKAFRHIDIDISDLIAEYPSAVATLYHKRGIDDEAYPCTTQMLDTNTMRWVFSAVDTANKGYGEAQIFMATSDGNHIGRSKIMETITGRSLTGSEDVPEEYEPFIDQIAVLKAEIEELSDHVDDTVESFDAGVETAVAQIATKKGEAIAEIGTSKTQAVTEVNSAKTQSVSAVNTAKTEALDALGVKYNEIYQVATSAMAGITFGGNEQINAVKAEGTTQKSDIDAKTAEFKTYLSEQKEDIVTSATQATSAKNDAISAKNDAVTAKQQAESAVAGVNQVNASVAKSGNTATITMTSKTGTVTTATVTDGVNGTDGEDGKPGVYVQDTQPTESDAKVWLKENGAQTVKLLTESDLPDSVDVQINGTSIVEDGVANIPLATQNTLGVVSTVPNSFGIGTNSNGALYVVRASESYISGRTGGYLPITSPNLNYAVKASLTDSNHLTMTSAEQDNACAVLGAERKLTDGWVLKGTLAGNADDRGNIDTGVTVDLTGCTGMYIFGWVTGTANSSLKSNAGMLINNFVQNGMRSYYGRWCDSPVGTDAITLQRSSSKTPSDMINTVSQAYNFTNGNHISNITSVLFTTSSTVTECNIQIYAR